MSEVSSVAAATNDNKVQILNGSEDSEVEEEQQTNETLSPTPSMGIFSQGVNK
jgi:hypothetical protein